MHQGVAPLHQFATRKIAGHGAHHQQDEQGEEAPQPGIWIPSNLSGCHAPGRICKVWSSVLTIQFNTQAVMTPGTMTSKPVNSHLRKADITACQVEEDDGVLLGLLARGRSQCSGRRSRFRLGFGGWGGATPLPPRKSVTYQPEPLSWKPAAVTCLRKPLHRRRGMW